MNTTLQIRIDRKTKRDVSGVFKKLGLDLSTGVKIYFHQVIRSQAVPFPLVTENGFTSEEEHKILVESIATHKLYKKGKRKAVKSAKQLFVELSK